MRQQESQAQTSARGREDILRVEHERRRQTELNLQLTQDNEMLRHQLERANAEVARRATLFEEMRAQLSAVRTEILSRDTHPSEADLKREIVSLQQQLVSAQEKERAAGIVAEELRTRFESAAAEAVRAQAEATEHAAAADGYRRAAEELRRRQGGQQEETGAPRPSGADTDAERQKLQQEAHTLRQRADEMAQNAKLLEVEHSRYIMENQAAGMQIEGMRAFVAQAQGQLVASREQLLRQQAVIMDLEAHLSAQSHEVVQLESQIHGLRSALRAVADARLADKTRLSAAEQALATQKGITQPPKADLVKVERQPGVLVGTQPTREWEVEMLI